MSSLTYHPSGLYNVHTLQTNAVDPTTSFQQPDPKVHIANPSAKHHDVHTLAKHKHDVVRFVSHVPLNLAVFLAWTLVRGGRGGLTRHVHALLL